MSHLRLIATSLQFHYPKCKTKSSYCSIDVHFQDGAGSRSPWLLPLRTPNTSFMDLFNQLPNKLPKIQWQNELTLHWHSFTEWGTDCIAFPCAYWSYQYIGYTQQQPNNIPITMLEEKEQFRVCWHVLIGDSSGMVSRIFARKGYWPFDNGIMILPSQ
jgi:hypothetical protein